MNAIEINGLEKLYGGKAAVKDLSMSVKDGEFFALLGVNGAGKTTTIKMLTCLLKPTKGDALLYGHSIRSDMQAVKALTNVSPQETAVAPNLTVRENLEFMAGIYGVRDPRETAEQTIAQFELGEVARSLARTLSGGWQRRLSIAMALISQPRVLFLDEPTLGLDVLARRELWKGICAQKGKLTVVLTTHYLEEAEALADRIGIMVNGELRAAGTPQELKALAGKDSFEEAFIAIATQEAVV